MSETIFPAFVRLQYQPSDDERGRFLQAVNETVEAGNRSLGNLGKGLDPLAEFSARAAKQLDAIMKGGNGSDLGAGAAREAAAAMEARAAAARDLALATEQAARAAGDDSQAARLAIVATQAQAREEAEAAQAARVHAEALEQVQAQLAKVTAASGRAQAANDNAAAASGRFRAGAQQLGYQISDLGVQLGMAAGSANVGKMAFMAFGQQIPQVVQAIALMQGEARGLTAFLAGPWGAAIMAGVSILGSLAIAHESAADASKDHRSAAEDLTKAIEDLHDATVRESRSTQASIQADIDKATGLRQRAQEARKAAVAELELAQQRARSAGASVSIGAPGYSNAYNIGEQAKQEAAARDAAASVTRINAEIAANEETIRLKRGAQIRQGVTEASDPRAAATGRYERALDKLNAQLKAGTISEAAYRNEVTKATQARDAATEAAKRSTESHRSASTAAREAARAAEAAEKAWQRTLEANNKALQAANKDLSETFRAADTRAHGTNCSRAYRTPGTLWRFHSAQPRTQRRGGIASSTRRSAPCSKSGVRPAASAG